MVRAYFLGKMMRQAKPDDVFTFATLAEIEAQFVTLERYLGRTREFWVWLLGKWRDRGNRQAVGGPAFRDELVDRVVAAVRPQSSSSS